MNLYGLIIPLAIALTLIALTYKEKGTEGIGAGFTESGNLFLTVLPNLIIGFTLAGFIAIILPQDVVARWIGEDSGMKGLLVGTVAGSLTPGGPFTHFPILASLVSQGAAIGPISAYIAAWALLGIHRIIIWEGPILGWRFVMIRTLSCLIFPVIIGAFASFIASIFPKQVS